MIDLPAGLLAVIAYAQSSPKWPSESERAILQRLNTWAAIRECDTNALKTVAGYTDQTRRYRVDSLGERIADSWAHYLAGQDPVVTPANDADIALMADLLDVNDFPSELERAAGLSVSEGEIWARGYRDDLVAPRPLLDWVSRRNVLPFYIGPRLAGAAIHTELPTPSGAARGTVYRHMEVHAAGAVANVLFQGKTEELGERVELTTHPATFDLVELWQHNLPGMLVYRIPNRLRSDKRLGVSDYAGILDPLLDLNELAIIGAHNMRLTARKRAVISAGVAASHQGNGRDDLALTPEENGLGGVPRARFDASEEVFVEDALDRELGREANPIRILEYSFDAEPLIAYKRDLVDTCLSRVGLVPQFVGAGLGGQDGYAISGTALRLRLIPTDAAGRAKARYWDDGIPKVLAMLAALDNAPSEAAGFDRSWSDSTTLPTFTRRPGLPEDEVEEAQRHATLVGAGVESIETAVRDLRPDWDDTEIDAEVERIRADKAAAAPAGMFGP